MLRLALTLLLAVALLAPIARSTPVLTYRIDRVISGLRSLRVPMVAGR